MAKEANAMLHTVLLLDKQGLFAEDSVSIPNVEEKCKKWGQAFHRTLGATLFGWATLILNQLQLPICTHFP
jgi:hypothetical protein